MLLAHWGFAQAHEVHVIPETQDYSTALELATEHNAFLLVSIEFHGKEKRDGVRNHLSKETTRTLFHKSMHKWVFCFLTMEDATTLITNPSLREMRQGPGVFVVDCTTGPLSGRIISILPKTPGKYGVRGIPTLILFKGGEIVEQVTGAVPKSQIEELVKKAI